MRRPIGEWRVVSVDLWYSPGQAAASQANAGFGRAIELLARAAAARPEEVRLVDVSGFGEFERWQVYARHARGCGYWGYALADVFGSHARAGSLAGLTVPLLGVRFREAEAPCAAPHRDIRPPRVRTILDLLGALSAAEQERFFGEPV